MKRKKQKRKLVAEINVVPYIDVTLVLMVIFMITAPLLMQGVKVDLPIANSAPINSEDRDPFIVSIKNDFTRHSLRSTYNIVISRSASYRLHRLHASAGLERKKLKLIII